MASGKRSVTEGVVDGIGLPLTGRDPISACERCDVYIRCSRQALGGVAYQSVQMSDGWMPSRMATRSADQYGMPSTRQRWMVRSG